MRKNRKWYTALALSLFLSGCSQNVQNEQLIGYWMGPYGGTITFTDEENCTYGTERCTYQIYDDNHIQLVSSGGDIKDMTFKLENEKLYIKYTGANDYEEFTKDEKEQQEIIERNREEQAAQQRESQKKEQIAEIQAQIDEQEQFIEDAKGRIKTNEKDIQKWEEDIELQKRQCEEAIAFGDDREYQENQRDDFIAADNEAIEECRKRIRELRKEIKGYKAEITKLKKNRKEIEEN